MLPEAGANQSRCQVEGSTPQMASEMMEGEVESGVSPLGLQTGIGQSPALVSHSRDIFPLPLPRVVPKVESLSKRFAQRVARKTHNCMRSHPLQREVLRRVDYLSKLCQDIGSLPRVPGTEAALKELLRGRSEYGSEAPTTLATCSIERISLPASLHGAPAVVDIVDEEARRYLQCPEQMLKEYVSDDFQPYWDPLLRRDGRMYKKFIRMLDKAGYLQYTQRPKSMCGVFFVKKSDGQETRLILDARGTNRMFRALTSDGFSRIELVVPQHLQPGTPAYDHYLEKGHPGTIPSAPSGHHRDPAP